VGAHEDYIGFEQVNQSWREREACTRRRKKHGDKSKPRAREGPAAGRGARLPPGRQGVRGDEAEEPRSSAQALSEAKARLREDPGRGIEGKPASSGRHDGWKSRAGGETKLSLARALPGEWIKG